MKLMDLPEEVLLRLINVTKRKLCAVNKSLLVLYNESYMHKTLSLFPIDCPIWGHLIDPLTDIISKLDKYRKPVRLLLAVNIENSSTTDITKREFIADSWYIVYGLLQSRPFVCNSNIFSNIQQDEPIMHCSSFTIAKSYPYPRKIPVNIWLSISDTSFIYPVRNIITNIMSSLDLEKNEEFSLLGQICDWIKVPGIYCVKLGSISAYYMDTPCTPYHLVLKIVASLTGNYTWNNSQPIRLLGYDFNSYLANLMQPWILFRLDLKYESVFYQNEAYNINAMISHYYNSIISGNNTSFPSINQNQKRSEIEISADFKLPVQVISSYPDQTSDQYLSIPDPRLPHITSY